MTPAPAVPAPKDAGEVSVEGESATLVFRRQLAHPPDRVWSAITEPEQIRSWQLTEARIDGRKGGTVDFVTGPDRVHGTGRILEWDPPRLWEYEWNIPPGPYVPKGEAAIVRWELRPIPTGTLVILTHRRLTRATAIAFSRGLRGFLDRLAAQLDGSPLPAWPPPSRVPGAAG